MYQRFFPYIRSRNSTNHRKRHNFSNGKVLMSYRIVLSLAAHNSFYLKKIMKNIFPAAGVQPIPYFMNINNPRTKINRVYFLGCGLGFSHP